MDAFEGAVGRIVDGIAAHARALLFPAGGLAPAGADAFEADLPGVPLDAVRVGVRDGVLHVSVAGVPRGHGRPPRPPRTFHAPVRGGATRATAALDAGVLRVAVA